MGRFDVTEVDCYGGQGGSGFFSLKNDKDIARVRFMYEGINSVAGYAVHEVEVDGKKRYVNCLRNYNDPIDTCPFCAAHKPQVAKMFIPLYNVDTKRIQIWERGKKFFGRISGLCSRYPNLVAHTFEIERNGAAGSSQTTYEIYEVGADNTTLKDLPELPKIIGGVVLDKSAEELSHYLKHGQFDEAAFMNEPASSEEVVRRTPMRRGDRF